MKFQDFSEEKPQWNMGLGFMQRLNNLLILRDEARINNQIWEWYRVNSCIIANIWYKIKEEGISPQEKAMLNKFQDIKYMLNSLAGRQGIFIKESLSNVEIELEKFDMQISELMHEYNLLGMKKKKYKPEEAIKEMFINESEESN